jgi:uncharacterized protein YjbI with pentapeptide repeats
MVRYALGKLSHQLTLPQRPNINEPVDWQAKWKVQNQPWRTEREIDVQRQSYLAKRRSVPPDIKQGIYPFKDIKIKLSRADVEWLLVTHENEHGPVVWSDENQRDRKGLDMRGADLRQVDLHNLPLTRIRGGLYLPHLQGMPHKNNLLRPSEEQYNKALVLLEGANLAEAHLEGAYLYGAHLEGAILSAACLKGVNLENATLCDEKQHIGPLLADAQWNDVNLAVVKWEQLNMLGDEYEAKQKKSNGKMKDRNTRLVQYEAAVRANRQLSVALQGQGLNEDAARFAYRAQLLQKGVFWFQMLKHNSILRQRVQTMGAWLFSWFLFLVAGYGYRLWRSFVTYGLVIVGFATTYYLLGPHLVWNEAIVISLTAFHGRGFFPEQFKPGDPQAMVAALEALVGLIIEITFIATLSQRFFGK